MIVINDIEQGTPEWERLRLGVVTGSSDKPKYFSEKPKLAPLPTTGLDYKKEGKDHIYTYEGVIYQGTNKAKLESEIRSDLPMVYGDMRAGLIDELAGDFYADSDHVKTGFKQAEHGHAYEDEARGRLQVALGYIKIDVPAFIYKDNAKRFGVSPDGIVNGLFEGKKTGVEIKCPTTRKAFAQFTSRNVIKPEYIEQMQFSMWVTGFEQWIYCNYYPGAKPDKSGNARDICHVVVDRDPVYMEKYDAAAEKFSADLDERLQTINSEFGDQWL